MTAGEPSSDKSVSLSQARRIDELCDRLEAGWRDGQSPGIEALLGEVDEAEKAECFHRLLELEIELRERRGECPWVEEYLTRFPEQASRVALVFRGSTVWQGGRSRARATLPAVPGYEVQAEIGRGGMGVVYRARHLKLQRLVALKMIRGVGDATREERQRFRAEAEAQARLLHPNVVQIFEVGEVGDQPYVALEYVAGGSLAAVIADGSWPIAEGCAAAQLVETLARAVQAAHEAGIVHRDLKPGNVLIQRATTKHTNDTKEEKKEPSLPFHSCVSCVSWLDSSVPKITDFGLARCLGNDHRQTPTGAVVGTPSYAAPEQAAGQRDVGPAADVYSLGAILYELLAGRPPFRAATPLQTLEQVCTRDPIAPMLLQPDCPADINNIALKCLEKEPRRRYPSALALADDLRRYLEGRPVTARPLSRAMRTVRWVRRNPLVASLLATVLLVFLLGFATTLWQLRVANANLREARYQQERYEQAFRKARDAVDVLTQISSRDLADRPNTRAARRKLLQTALRYYEEFQAERGDDASLRADLALTQLRLADLTASLGERDRALPLYRAALDHQRQVVADDPDNDRQRRHLAGTCTNLANLLLPSGPTILAEATALHEEAMRAWEQSALLCPHDIDVRHELARAHVNVAVAYSNGNRHKEAQQALTTLRTRLDEWIRQAPSDVHFRLIQARTDRLLGDELATVGHRDEALRVQQQGIARCDALHRAHPRDLAVTRECALAQHDLAILLRKAGQVPAARQSYEQAITLWRELLPNDPEDASLSLGLSRSSYNLGILCRAAGDLAAAHRAFDEAVTLHRKLLADAPEDRPLRNQLNDRLLRLAAVLREQGNLEASLRISGEREKLSPDNAEQLFLLACEYADCVPRVKDGQPVKGYADLALAALRRALKHGYKNVQRLREEPTLAPLRGLAEYQKLVKQLEGSR